MVFTCLPLSFNVKKGLFGALLLLASAAAVFCNLIQPFYPLVIFMQYWYCCFEYNCLDNIFVSLEQNNHTPMLLLSRTEKKPCSFSCSFEYVLLFYPITGMCVVLIITKHNYALCMPKFLLKLCVRALGDMGVVGSVVVRSAWWCWW